MVKCQTTFFPANTVRHEFAFRLEQFARKQTTYRALVNLCKELEIKDEISKKEMRDILVGTEMDSERPFKELQKVQNKRNEPETISTLETMDTSQSLITGNLLTAGLFILLQMKSILGVKLTISPHYRSRLGLSTRPI